MHSNSKHLLDIIAQESRLPGIDADACVYATFDQADCKACVDACPKHAWVLDDYTLGLDTDACDGCGLCVPACHNGALHIHFPWVIRTFGGLQLALFACEYSDIHEEPGILPCIHALGLRQLLLLYNSGIQNLLTATANCEDCARHNSKGIHHKLERLNSLLHERKQPPLNILDRSSHAWKTIFNTDEVVSQGTQMPRRQFLRGGGQLLRRQLVVVDPLNLPEGRTTPPGQLLPATDNENVHWPWAPHLDESQCNGCDACMKLCPTDALQLINDKENSSPGYQLNPASCTGCGICTAVCELQAISVHSMSLSTPRSIYLTENRCTACGNTFHLPRDNNSQPDAQLCRICQEHNHSRNLYQVLNEN
jgi:ferredoxin